MSKKDRKPVHRLVSQGRKGKRWRIRPGQAGVEAPAPDPAGNRAERRAAAAQMRRGQ